MSAVQYFHPVDILNQRIECETVGEYSVKDDGEGFVSLDYHGESIIRIKMKDRLHTTVYNEICLVIAACFHHAAIDAQRELIGL